MNRQIFRRNGSGQNKRENGMQLVEMAFSLPILLLILSAIVELSLYFYTYSTLARSTRAGAGYVYNKNFSSAEVTNTKNLVVCGVIASCSGVAPVVEGLASANVDVALSGTSPNQTVTVKIINYSYTPTPFFNPKNIGGANWDTTITKVSAATTMRYVGDR